MRAGGNRHQLARFAGQCRPVYLPISDPLFVLLALTRVSFLFLLLFVCAQLTCLMPVGQGNNLVVGLTTSGGQVSNTTRFSFNAPSILSVVPPNGLTTGGYTVTIYGASFGLTAITTFVSTQTGAINTCSPVGIGQTNTIIQCSVPAGQGPFFRLFVNVSRQVSSPGVPFTYNATIIAVAHTCADYCCL